MGFEIVLGRWLALCTHPVCAWHLRSRKARAVVVASYMGASYVAVLGSLLIAS